LQAAAVEFLASQLALGTDKTDETTGEESFVSFVSSPCGRFRIFSALSSFPAISVR
jgi:hypothetical protein